MLAFLLTVAGESNREKIEYIYNKYHDDMIRFARFNNIPELISMFKQVADIQTSDMLNLPVPKANFHIIKAKPSEIQKEMVQGFAERAEKIHNGLVKSDEDNMLLVTNDGRKAALDQRLLNPMLPDFEESKVNMCVQNVYEIWEKNADKKSAQLVFCDLSTPKNDGSFNVYDDIRTKLISFISLPRFKNIYTKIVYHIF